MPITTIPHTPPIRRPGRAARPDYAHFDAAHALAEAGNNRAALQAIFSHLFPRAEVPDLAVAPFTFTQGSSRVTARLEGEELVISAPLVKLPTGRRAIAALRFVLTRVSALGQLYQPRLRGDDLQLEFRDKLSRLHPAKVLEVLQRMPNTADDCGDWLIGQFGALPIDRATIAVLDGDELQRAEAEWRRHWNDIEELARESQRKCSTFFLDALTTYALNRVHFALPLCGFLSGRLEEAAATFNDREVEHQRREAALARCAREMKAVPGDELRRNLGHAEYGISSTSDGNSRILNDLLGPAEYSQSIDDLRKAGQPMDAAVALLAAYMYLLAAFVWPSAVEAALEDGLVQASGKPWRQAAAILFNHGRKVASAFASGDVNADGCA